MAVPLDERARADTKPEEVETPRFRRTLRALDHPLFRRFWIGQLVSQGGTWMQSVAQAWLVLQLTGSPFALGVVTALQFLPITGGSMVAGVLVDRFPKRRVLLLTNGLAMLQAAILAVLAATSLLQLWQLYVMALMLGCINAVDAPARQAIVSELVDRDHLVSAVGLNAATQSGSRLVGPAVGGLVIAAWGVATCFALNALSFLAVLVALLGLPDRTAPSGARGRSARQVPRELAEGLRFVFGDPRLAGLIVALTGLGIFGFNYSTVLPLLATQGLQLGPEGLGFLSAASGAGALVSALGLAGSGRPALAPLFLAAGSFGVLLAAASRAEWFPAALLLVALFSCVGTWFSMSSNSVLQLHAPDALRGRVMGLYTTLVMGATPLGALLTSMLATVAGIRATMLAWGVICVLAAFAGYLTARRSPPRPA